MFVSKITDLEERGFSVFDWLVDIVFQRERRVSAFVFSPSTVLCMIRAYLILALSPVSRILCILVLI